MAKNILIFSDGTGQIGGIRVDERRSNIYKLYRATRVGHDSTIDPAKQVAYYDAGLGSRPPGGGLFKTIYRMVHNLVSQATGFGLTTNIIDCYEMIIRLWRPGDRIYLFGFSRGAYTARSVGGVLALCGVPTRLGPNEPIKYDSGTVSQVAERAVKKVYQHTASFTPSKATPRKKELLAQRNELARLFRERHGVDHDKDKSHYPYFIGVFDTVAAVASTGSLVLVIIGAVAAAAILSHLLVWAFPLVESWVWGLVGSIIRSPFELAGLPTDTWFGWFAMVGGASLLAAAIWYVLQSLRFAPSANPRNKCRTLTINFGRMRFEDKTLNGNVKYARHAISIDEDRASFARVGWGSTRSTRPKQDDNEINTFEQVWFAGNHSDVGGSYPEVESRLSDISLEWMVKAATQVENGIDVDESVLSLHPSADGMQHDQRKKGIPVITRWFGLTWPRALRVVPGPKASLHPTVYERIELPAVLQYDVMAPYRPEALRNQTQLAHLYPDPASD